MAFDFSQADRKIFAVFGSEVEYTLGADGTKKTVQGIFDEGIELIQTSSSQDYGASVVDKTNTCAFRRADIDNPAKGDRLKIGNATFRVEEEIKRDNLMVIVRLGHDY